MTMKIRLNMTRPENIPCQEPPQTMKDIVTQQAKEASPQVTKSRQPWVKASNQIRSTRNAVAAA
mgnify:CR=1 FL=1